MRTQHAGNQKIAGRCCLKATALGASGAHDAYRIRAHTFYTAGNYISAVKAQRFEV